MMNRWVILLILFLLILLTVITILTGCMIRPIELGPIKQSPIVTEPKNESTIPISGGELLVAISSNIDNLNPLNAKTAEIASFMSLIFEGLVCYDDNGRLQPNLADSWKVDADGMTWTFHIRKGIKWQTIHSELAASDVIFTLDLLKTDKIQPYYKKNFANIESYQEVDPYTITLKTKKSFNGILDFMTIPILSKEYYIDKIDNPLAIPVGTGPYQVTEFDKMKQMNLVINKNWWKKQPYIQKINAKIYPDNDVALKSYEAKQTDLVLTSALTSSRYKETNDTKVYEYMTQNYDLLIPNINHTFFQDNNVRKAIAYAIDRKEIVTKVYLNHAVPVDVPIPSDSWLYEQKLKTYDYNLEQSKILFAQSGWKDSNGDGILEKSINGNKIDAAFTLVTNDDAENPTRKEAAKLIKQQLLKVGVRVDIIALNWDVFLKVLDERKFDMALTGYFLDRIPDLSFAFHSGNAIAGKKNYGLYINNNMDMLLQNIQQEIKPDLLRSKYVELQKMIIDDLPCISLYFRTNSLIARNKINGIIAHRELEQFHNIEQWYITQ